MHPKVITNANINIYSNHKNMSTAFISELPERYYTREQAEQRAEYLRIGTFKNTIVEEKDEENRWTGKVEHIFKVIKRR